MPLKGADVSGYQGNIDFDKVKPLIKFLITKVTEGTTYINPTFKRNQAEARRVGLTLGYYHFARPNANNSPQAEAEFFLKSIGEIEEGELLFLDFEVGYSDAVGWCKAWLDHVSAKLNGYKPLIYLNLNQNLTLDWKPVVDANYGLWLAYYNPTLPNTDWDVVAFHQYTSSGALDGIVGKVDLNYFYGDEAALKAYGYVPEPPVTDTCEIKLKKVKEDLATAKSELRKKAGQMTTLETKLNKAKELANGYEAELKTVNGNFKQLEQDYKSLLDQCTDNKTTISNLNNEITRLKSQKFKLGEIIGFLINLTKKEGGVNNG